MQWEVKYNNSFCGSNFYGDHGSMMVSNSINGVLILHEKDIYEHQELGLGRKVVRDICNCLRPHGYSVSLNSHYNNKEKADFNKLLDSEILESERRLKELKFAKTILSRKKVIFKKVKK